MKKIIISLDCPLQKAIKIMKQTGDMEEVYGYKIGFHLVFTFGLIRCVNEVKFRAPSKKVIYDHQKGGNDIPKMGMNFASAMKMAGVDEAILFPFAGPDSLDFWLKELKKRNIETIVGGKMTHQGFSKEEGGFFSDEDSLKIYKQAADFGVNRFVLPPNKHDFYEKVSSHVGGNKIIYSPGFGAQGCEDNSYTDYPIIGRSIYNSEDPKESVLEWYEKLCKEERQ